MDPDLSPNDPEKQKDSGGIAPDNTGAEIHCTVFTIAESLFKEGLIWIGTDDVLVQITQEAGKTWTNVTANTKGLPPDSWVTRIEASHFATGAHGMAYKNDFPTITVRDIQIHPKGGWASWWAHAAGDYGCWMISLNSTLCSTSSNFRLSRI